MTDKELITGCIRKERDFQKALFDKYAGKMLSVCRRYAKHHMEAEDMMQDGFIKVFEKMDQFEFRGSLDFWIRRIMINTSIKYLRKSSHKNELIGQETLPEKISEPTVYSKLSEDELMKLIGTLPEGYKIVFNLYAIEGFSHKEIADMLEIKESTSRSQLVKARKMLQSMILRLHKTAV